MRRQLIAIAALGLLGALIGCNHTAGICDCDTGCCGGGAPGYPVPAPGGILRPEPLRMPKENDAAKPANLPLEKAKEVVVDEK